MDPSGRLPKQVQLPGESVGRAGEHHIVGWAGAFAASPAAVARSSANIRGRGRAVANPVALLHIVTFSDWRLTSRCGF